MHHLIKCCYKVETHLSSTLMYPTHGSNLMTTHGRNLAIQTSGRNLVIDADERPVAPEVDSSSTTSHELKDKIPPNGKETKTKTNTQSLNELEEDIDARHMQDS